MADTPRDYDTEYTVAEGGPARRGVGIDVEQGAVARFVVQLEYLTDPVSDNWSQVVRYDHGAKGSAESAHNVTEDGLHIDIYREGEKVDSHELTPPMPASQALGVAEEHVEEYVEG